MRRIALGGYTPGLCLVDITGGAIPSDWVVFPGNELCVGPFAAREINKLLDPCAAAEAKLEQARVDGVINRWAAVSPCVSRYAAQWSASVHVIESGLQEFKANTKAEALQSAVDYVENKLRKPPLPDVSKMNMQQCVDEIAKMGYRHELGGWMLTVHKDSVSSARFNQKFDETPNAFYRRAVQGIRELHN